MDVKILDNVKTTLGVMPDHVEFDDVILIHINSVFATLAQIGVGPKKGFLVDKNTKWVDYISDLDQDPTLISVRSYVYLSVRMLFDPPTSSFVLTSMKEQQKEFEWRLYVAADERKEEHE